MDYNVMPHTRRFCGASTSKHSKNINVVMDNTWQLVLSPEMASDVKSSPVVACCYSY